MASKPCNFFILFSFLLTLFFSISNSSSHSSTSTLSSSSSSLHSICNSTPYPTHCFEASKLSLSITLNPTILTSLISSIDAAISEVSKLSSLLSNAYLIEYQRGAVQDCKDLQELTLSSLQRSFSRVKAQSSDPKSIFETQTFLSAALTNRATCLESLEATSGRLKPTIITSIVESYKHVSNALSMLPKPEPTPQKARHGPNARRRTIEHPHNAATGPISGFPQARGDPKGFPLWFSKRARRALEIDLGLSPPSGSETDPSSETVVTVAKDGTGNFTTVGEAVKWAPSKSKERTVIYVMEGVYEENIEITRHKTNIVLVGDGSDSTVITGNRSVVDGWTTFRSATLAVSGDGFMARDITFENSAGPSKHQAVALRVNADLTAIYRCGIVGYQDSLYVHSFRQFYRECDIYGTIDFIFGNAIVIFQASNIVSRLPLRGQFTVVTAQSRDTIDENTGIVIQNCSILASDDLYNSTQAVRSYLGRPWKTYARTVVMESYIDDFIDSAGWSRWSGDQGLNTLYYGEYENNGPGSSTDGRVNWPGYHVMKYEDASNFTVSEFIAGDEWLQSTTVPYDDGV